MGLDSWLLGVISLLFVSAMAALGKSDHCAVEVA
jgi:hypothetical protein